jgi:hypothetical protein
MPLIESPSCHMLRDMYSDALFQHSIATSDLGSLTEALQDCSDVDIESQNFVKVLELSIKNGDVAAFAKLITYIPELRLKTKLQVADVHKERGVCVQLWNIFLQLVVSIVTEGILIITFIYALCYTLLYMVNHSSGRTHILSAMWYDHLHSSASPFSLWIILRVYNGMKHRFSREFLHDTLDGLLVFLWLAIATKFISPLSWFGSCLHEGLYSLSSFWGFQTRSTFIRYMPSWRRSYFSTILGSDHFLA